MKNTIIGLLLGISFMLNIAALTPNSLIIFKQAFGTTVNVTPATPKLVVAKCCYKQSDMTDFIIQYHKQGYIVHQISGSYLVMYRY